jgi:hypothetical protein
LEVSALRRELDALRSDIDNQISVSDKLNGNLLETAAQLQVALSSKAEDMSSLETLVSRMQDAHAADRSNLDQQLSAMKRGTVLFGVCCFTRGLALT